MELEAEMNIPVDIAKLIEQKKESLRIEETQKEADRARERAIEIENARKNLQQKIAERLLTVPEWLRPYDVTLKDWSEDRLENSKHSDFSSLGLVFEIPGLSQIIQNTKGNWMAAYPIGWSDGKAPEIGFFGNSYYRSDLEFVLIEAQENLMRFAELKTEYQEHLEWQRKLELENQSGMQEINAKKTINILAKETEEKALFNAFVNDQVAINLMKAFLMIRQERRLFEEQISSAEDSLCTVEERWSRKAADLRRQAEDAERHADEEHQRARDLEDEKDDIENRLKKVERGGW